MQQQNAFVVEATFTMPISAGTKMKIHKDPEARPEFLKALPGKQEVTARSSFTPLGMAA